MNFAIDAAKTWQKTGINPYTNRQDEAAFAGMLYKVINDPTSVTQDEIWLGTGKLWTTNDTLMLLNKKNKTDDKYGYTHPIIKQYWKDVDDLFPEEMSSEEAAQSNQIKLDLQNKANEVLDKPNGAKILEDEFKQLTSGIKKEKSKAWLLLYGSPLYMSLKYHPNKLAYKSGKKISEALFEKEKAPIEVKTLDEVKSLPKGTKFIYKGQEYERK